MKQALKREWEVAVSKNDQPAWLRLVKYIVLAVLLYIGWGSRWLLPLMIVLSVLAITIHFWYRYKTKGWKRSYGGWRFRK
jgi:hypothetical protein